MTRNKDSLVPAGTGNEGKADATKQLNNSISAPLYPKKTTMQACTLAVLLKGREISPVDMIFGQMRGTRLAGYIFDLKKRGLRGKIAHRDLAATQGQKKDLTDCRYRAYWLSVKAIKELGEQGQTWADEVIAFHGIELHKMQFAGSEGEYL